MQEPELKPRKPLGSAEREIKPDWKDFFALVIAAYQVLLPPLLLILGAAVLVLLVLHWLF